MSEFETQPASDEYVSQAPQPWEEDYQRFYGQSYAAPATSGTVSQTALTTAVGHYTEDPDQAQQEKDAASFDLAGRSLDVIGTAAGGSEFLEKLGAFGALPGDVLKTEKGVREGDVGDSFASGAGVISDLATMAGYKPIASIAGLAKGGTEIAQGNSKYNEGVEKDNDLMMVEGFRKSLDGFADGAAAIPEEHIGAGGKALGYGLALGDAMAPTVFGDKSVSSDVQKSDGTYVASTGNRAVDWVLGEGKFSGSRFDSDGKDAEERAESARIDAGLQSSMNAMNNAIEESSGEDRERLEQQRAIIEQLTGVKAE
jgi:hypothetical protein